MYAQSLFSIGMINYGHERFQVHKKKGFEFLESLCAITSCLFVLQSLHRHTQMVPAQPHYSLQCSSGGLVSKKLKTKRNLHDQLT